MDAFPLQSASAVSLNNLCRSVLGAVATIIALPWQEAWGIGWTMTTLGLINLVCGILILVVVVKGREWHDRRLSVINPSET